MSEKRKHEHRHEYLDTPMHVVALADAVLEQIGRLPDSMPSAGELAQFAQWRKHSKNSALFYLLERYDYDEQTRKYVLDIYQGEEVADSYMFRTRGSNEPKIYRVDQNSNEHELRGSKLSGAQDQLIRILTNANEQAAAKAEKQSVDREFEKIVGRYILSDLAYRPLGIGEDGVVDPQVVRKKVSAFNGRTIANEKIALWYAGGKHAVDTAIKNKPDPLINSRFISIDESLSTAIAAREIGMQWTNTFDTSKTPGERIQRVIVERSKEPVVQEQQSAAEPPEEGDTTNLSAE